MNNQLSPVTATIRQAKEIYGQIADLISSADGFMSDEEWTPRNNVAYKDSSQSHSQPNDWLPSAIYREYRNAAYSNQVLLLGVVLDNIYGIRNVDQPLIVGTMMSVPDESEEFPEVKYWDAFWWFLKLSVNADGETHSIEKPNSIYSGEKRDIDSIRVFARSLIEVEDSEFLNQHFVKVIIRLLDR